MPHDQDNPLKKEYVLQPPAATSTHKPVEGPLLEQDDSPQGKVVSVTADAESGALPSGKEEFLAAVAKSEQSAAGKSSTTEEEASLQQPAVNISLAQATKKQSSPAAEKLPATESECV